MMRDLLGEKAVELVESQPGRTFIEKLENIIFDYFGYDRKVRYPNLVKGYNDLSNENKEIFAEFLFRFYEAQGLEVRKDIVPLKVGYVRKEISENGLGYIRFDFFRADQET